MQRVRYKKGESTPIFLTGCGRSGTNYLVGGLSKSSQIRLYNESDSSAFDDWRLRDFDIIKNLISGSYAPVLLFKPINDTYRMVELLRNFENSKIIFQFRHFDDVVNSIVRGPFGERKSLVGYWIESGFREFRLYPPSEEAQDLVRSLYSDSLNNESGSALYWWLQNRFLIEQNLRRNSRVMLVQYEHMVNDPEKQFLKLCDFIGVECSENMFGGVSSSIRKNPAPDIRPEIRVQCEKLWTELA